MRDLSNQKFVADHPDIPGAGKPKRKIDFQLRGHSGGLFINDVTQRGERGKAFCDNRA